LGDLSVAGDLLQAEMLLLRIGKGEKSEGQKGDLPLPIPIGLVFQSQGDVKHVPLAEFPRASLGDDLASPPLHIGKVVGGRALTAIGVVIFLVGEAAKAESFGEYYLIHRVLPQIRGEFYLLSYRITYFLSFVKMV
jgi:hypothetical protein